METEVKATASKLRAGEASISGKQYLTFRQGNEIYGLPIIEVREVIDYGKTREIPLVPGYIHGVLNLRGSVLPVIDISYRFYKRKTVIGKTTSIIILDIHDEEERISVGIMIDAVNEVVFIPDTEIDDRPDFGTKIKSDFITSVGKIGGKYIILLNIRKVVDLVELSKFEGAV